MAKFSGPFGFSGSFGDFIIYRLPGIEKAIVRTKGTVSKKKRKTSPSYARVRENETEFGGRSTAISWINAALKGQTALPDFAHASRLNGVLKPLQEFDTVSPRGQRALVFSENPQLLNGFHLTAAKPLDSIILNPFECSISKQTLSAVVTIPRLLPRTSFRPGEAGSMYKIVVSLGIVPDMFYNGKGYAPKKGYSRDRPVASVETAWLPVNRRAGETELSLALARKPADTGFGLLLSVGIRFGTMVGNNNVTSTRAAGSAMILKMV